MRPGLERLCESYRTKASQLGQDLVSLREQCGARAEAVNERKEDMAGLETQVSHTCTATQVPDRMTV